ncbi:hypothetical protein MNB_SM-6-1623 [hydrothermal vent metagenome]|uniref:Uncharacterized protein n=1 Tax=hydrothermal vent metagenome TaxID=652676 RepID=A0A1W1CTV8_9ZZZZ
MWMGIIGDFNFNVNSFAKEFQIFSMSVSYRICFTYSTNLII